MIARATASIELSTTSARSAPAIGSHGPMYASRLGRVLRVAIIDAPAPNARASAHPTSQRAYPVARRIIAEIAR